MGWKIKEKEGKSATHLEIGGKSKEIKQNQKKSAQ